MSGAAHTDRCFSAPATASRPWARTTCVRAGTCEVEDCAGGACEIEDKTAEYNSAVGACPLQPSSVPVTVTATSASAVTVQFYQNFKDSSISWISVDCIDPDDPENQNGDPTGSDPGNPTCSACCPKTEEVDPGLFLTRRCMCRSGTATVAVYVHDGQIGSGYQPLDYAVPGHCSPSNDQGKKCRFVYEIPCGCGVWP